MDWPGISDRFKALSPGLLLLLILIVALGLRLYGVNWDDGNGFHPDERSIYMRAGCMYDVLTESPGYQDCIRDYPATEPGIPSFSVLLDADRSPLNPHWFPLGSILIYVIVYFRFIVELFAHVSALDMSYVGRPLSALADVGTVLMVYVLGRRMYGQGVGLLASGLTALAVVHIQSSHFYRPETFSLLFTLASFWAMLRVVERPSGEGLRDSALLGLLVGLALAPKVNVLPLVLPLMLVYGYQLLDSVGGRWSGITYRAVGRVLAHAALGGGIALVVFFATMPYALLDFGAFLGELAAQANMARHAGLWPFTTQYIDTPAFLYQIRQSTVWGLGLPLGIVAWSSVPFTAVLALWQRKTRRVDLLLLAWVVPNLLILESFEVRFLRYIFPLLPFMVLMGSRMLLWLVEFSQRMAWPRSPSIGEEPALSLPKGWDGGDSPSPRSSPTRGEEGGSSLCRGVSPKESRYVVWASVALVVFVIGSTAFYALAFEKVYANEHPAVTASRWLKENVPSGTAIVSDNHWDEFIPDLYRYNVWQYPVYEPDTSSKMDALVHNLAAADYLVFYSNRPYGSIARVPDRYPLSANYYQRLFRGELGYRLERTFTSYPELLGVSFEDDPFSRAGLPRPEPLVPREPTSLAFNLGYADDNVIGYDHPQVLLFRNVEKLPEGKLRPRLVADQTGSPAGESPLAPLSQRGVGGIGLMLSEEAKAVQRRGGTWSDIIHRDSWTNRLPVLAWLLVVELVYLTGLPLALFVFRPLPDRGIILARVLGLLTISYVSWLLVSLGWIGFSRAAILLGFLVIGSLSALVLALRWREIKGFLAQHWRLLLIGEGLFLVAFLAFVAIRAANPDLWHPWRGGEKPMELAYLNAVLRSTSMPPYDPWLAGGYMNYYYWGYFVLAALIKITGIVPTTAFNLAVPLLFALTVTGAYSLVYNLTEGVRRSRVATVTPSPWSRILCSPLSAGLVAALLIAVIGNLDGMVQLVQGAWYKAFDGQSFPPFDFWRSSRMLPDLKDFDPSPLAFWVPDKVLNAPDIPCYQSGPGAPECSPHITEFPFFTFLFADLHPHMMVIPFTLLVIGLGLNLVVGLRTAGGLWLVSATAALALALGALWLINSWDYPSYLLLTLMLLVLAVYLHPMPLLHKLWLFVALASGVVSLSLLAFLPFHQFYEAFDVGLSASKWRTPIDRYFGIHGLFLFVAATFLIYRARRVLVQVLGSLLPRPPGFVNTTIRARSAYLELYRLKATLAVGLLVVVFLAAAGYWTAAILMVFLILTGVAGREVLVSGSEDRPFIIVPLALLGLALAIGIGVDFVRLPGDIGRMNTFFKYYLEAWVLFSLAAAYMLWHLATAPSPPLQRRRGREVSLRGSGWRKGIWLGILALLVVSSLIYTVLGTRGRLSDRFNPGSLTLDGTAYMTQAVHREDGKPVELKWDLEAIRWLQHEVEGSPVVLEAHHEQYRWSARIANYTGLPTILGWPWHQIQQRMAYGYLVRDRAAVVREIYDTPDLRRTKELLREYEVKYIVVGQLERIYYSEEGLQKFEDMAAQGLLKRVFQNDGVRIYQVKL